MLRQSVTLAVKRRSRFGEITGHDHVKYAGCMSSAYRSACLARPVAGYGWPAWTSRDADVEDTVRRWRPV